MVAVDATTSVSTSRQRFLRCGLRNFHAGGDARHWHRSASRLARRSAALPHYSNSEVLSPRFWRSHSGNDPINNLDPSGHKHEKPPKPPTAAGSTKSASLKDSKVSTEYNGHADHAAEGGKTSAGHAADQRGPAFPPKHQTVANVQKIVGTKPDGVYGPKTKLAVKTFQEKLIHGGFLKPKQADGRPSDDGLWGSAPQRACEEYEKAHSAEHPATSRPAKSAPEKATGATPAATHSAPRVAKLPPVPKPPANGSRAAREQWVRQMAVYIDAWLKAHDVRGLDGKTLAAQFAAENNWGLNKLAQVSNNWGNIKGKGPAGSQMRGGKGPFRKYHTLGQFLADYTKIMRRTYPQAIGKSGAAYYSALQSGRYRYSTNPHYAGLLTTIYKQVFGGSH